MAERIIPESVIKYKNPEKRKKLLTTYFEMNRKSKRLAFSWWFFLWPIAAHRIYLNQYKSAIIVATMSLFAFTLVAVNESSGKDMNGIDGSLFFLLPFVIYLAEGLLLIVSVMQANNRINTQLTDDIESVSYVPLSNVSEKVIPDD